MKKYCLLENGDIEPCYYLNGELRNFDYENGSYYLIYDKYAHNMILTCRCKVVKFADNPEDLLKEKL